MKEGILLLLLGISLNITYSQITVPNTFAGGDTISAAEMNANFQELSNAINTLQDDLDAAENTISSLSSDLTTAESTINTLSADLDTAESNVSTLTLDISTLETQLETFTDLPIGTVISSMMTPTDFTSTMGDDWVLADGRSSTMEYYTAFNQLNIPDMRGQFLRGMNEGRSDGNEDPDDRTVGSLQDDAFQGHKHASGHWADGTPLQFQASSYPLFSARNPYDNETGIPINDGANGDPRTAQETRPSNIAIYWYIKVK